MRLRDALTLAEANKRLDGNPIRLSLACGFTPLHLPGFLIAHLASKRIGSRIEVSPGPYGDLCEAVDRLGSADTEAALIIIEFSDLDPRLGLRRSGGWQRAAVADAVCSAKARLTRLQAAIEAVSKRVVIMLPTLPLPPMFSVGQWQESRAELELNAQVACFASALSDRQNVVICRPPASAASALHERRDVQAELVADFPYSLSHASAVAAAMAAALFPPSPLKGIITDLDDTLWRGLVGEVGPQNVHWSLDGNSQIHAIYQQILGSLAEQGVLIAIASKNAPDVVQQALSRTDLLIDVKSIFPIEAGWGQKSESVRRILAAWNIGADAVIFIDDNPLELAEVAANFTDMRTMIFPVKSNGDALRLFGELRDLFHREAFTPEDSLRVDSLRGAQDLKAAAQQAVGQAAFLQTLDSSIAISFSVEPGDARPLELVNKTNQFNLNGRRWPEAQWRSHLDRQDGFVAVVSYTDKFGPLGRVSVVLGHTVDRCLVIVGWVLSCRAFSRRIEYAVLRTLFDRFDVDTIRLEYTATERNGPIQEFVTAVAYAIDDDGALVKRSHYDDSAPATHHIVTQH